jgi:hypothetical protein
MSGEDSSGQALQCLVGLSAPTPRQRHDAMYARFFVPRDIL